jgi:hypothetical protein
MKKKIDSLVNKIIEDTNASELRDVISVLKGAVREKNIGLVKREMPKKINEKYTWGYSYTWGNPPKKELNWVRLKINSVLDKVIARFSHSPYVGNYAFQIVSETKEGMREALRLMKQFKHIECIDKEMYHIWERRFR